MSENDNDLKATIFGWVGTVIATYFYISPIEPYLKLIKGEITYKESPIILLICSFLNCLLWSIYGIFEGAFLIYFANGLGGGITLIFITTFLIHFAGRNILYSFLYILLLIIVVSGINCICYFIINPEITGIMANVFNVLMYAATGEKMYTVFKTGRYNLIPILSVIGGFASSTSWMLYGFFQDNPDYLIIIPNGIGAIFSIIQIIIFIVIKKRAKNDDSTEISSKCDTEEYSD